MVYLDISFCFSVSLIDGGGFNTSSHIHDKGYATITSTQL
jgi:hypothetical protein